MVTLHEVLKQAETEGVAIGHFNVSDLVTLKAVCFPKIISGRNGGAARTGSGWRQ
jgi:fructose/tagatose bisphosphate aldolase